MIFFGSHKHIIQLVGSNLRILEYILFPHLINIIVIEFEPLR